MAVSIVMVSYYTGPVLKRSIQAALDTSSVEDIIVVDNGNPSAVTEELEAWSRSEERLTLLSGHGNIGFASACNMGAERATSDALFFLNPDAVLGEGAVATLSAEAERQSQTLWAVGPKLVNPDGTEQQGSRREILTPWNAFVEASRLYKLAPNHPRFRRFNNHEAEEITETTAVPCLSGAAFMISREAFDLIGGFDQGYFLHVEDIDLFLRLGKAGGRVLYVPDAEVRHFKSSSRVDPLRIERLKKRSLNRYFEIHYAGIYPKGFLTLLRGMLWLSFGFRVAKWRIRRTLGFVPFVLRKGIGGAARARRQAKRLRRLGKQSSSE